MRLDARLVVVVVVVVGDGGESTKPKGDMPVTAIGDGLGDHPACCCKARKLSRQVRVNVDLKSL